MFGSRQEEGVHWGRANVVSSPFHKDVEGGASVSVYPDAFWSLLDLT